MMSVTIQDIAEAAGVSIATVSRALRGVGKRQTAAQQRILQISRELGYGRVKGKAGHARSATGQILFLDSAFSDQTLQAELHHGPMFSAIQQVIEPQGFSLMISNIAGNKPLPPALQAPELLSGVLIHGPFSRTFFNDHLRGVPVVGMQYVNHELPCSWVATDNHAGIFQMVRHLKDLGHERIGFLANEVERFHSRQRLLGYREALATLDLERRPAWEITWQRPFVAGILPREESLPDFSDRLAPVFTGSASTPTALITTGDWQARAIIASLQKLQLRVPEDVSVTGFGHPLTETWFTGPAQTLTTLNDQLETVAATAAQLLMDQIAVPPDRPITLLIQPSLAIGGSTSPVDFG